MFIKTKQVTLKKEKSQYGYVCPYFEQQKQMITKKKLKEEIITYDIITYKDDDGKDIEYVEVTLVDRIIDVYMDTREVNIGILANKILEDNLYKE